MFIFSKIIGFFLNPFLWIVALALFALMTRDSYRRKRRLIAAGLLLLLFSAPLIINKLTIAWQPASRELSIGEHFETGILLGGYTIYDETEKKGYFTTHADRFLETARLYKSGHLSKVIITGGQPFPNPDGFLEADFSREKLLEMGIPAQDIIVEARSRNTKENAKFTRTILDSMHVKGRQLLITSAMHMPRAEKIFRNEGISVDTYPCAYMVVPKNGKWQFDQWLPNARSFELWNVYLRELVGWIAAGNGK